MPSKNENAVAALLSSIPLPFKREYTFPDLKGQKSHPYRFDFAILSPFGGVAYLIEVNGEQHYEAVSQFGGVRGLAQTKFRDNRKIAYCRAHNIPLLIIPYTAIKTLTVRDVTLYSRWRVI